MCGAVRRSAVQCSAAVQDPQAGVLDQASGRKKKKRKAMKILKSEETNTTCSSLIESTHVHTLGIFLKNNILKKYIYKNKSNDPCR